jgi:hypothetical protein
MRKQRALVWAGAAAVLLALSIALIINIRSNADASAPTASVAPPAAATPTAQPPPPPPPPRSMTGRPDVRGPLPEPPAGTMRPGPAPAPEVLDLDDADRAARMMLQYDTSDFGKVVETLEDGTAVGRVRGAPVTEAEQETLRREIAKMAGAYETAYDRALTERNEPEFARVVHTAREEFDRRVRELYHLSEQQFFELFPHRRTAPQ